MSGKARLVALCLLIVAVIGMFVWMNRSQDEQDITPESRETQISEPAGDDVAFAQDLKDSSDITGPEKKGTKKRDRTQKDSAEQDQIPTGVEGVFAFGRVVDEVGNPVQGAEVYLLGASRFGTSLNQKGDSDQQGRFHFDKLATGSYILSATKGDYVSFGSREQMKQFEIKEETTQVGPFVLKMKKGRILNVRVVSDASGEPLEGAQVKALRQGRVAITDAQGMVRFPLSEDAWQVDVTAEGYGQVSKHYDLTQTEERSVVVRLPKGGVVFGRVSTMDNEPLPKATVIINCEGAYQSVEVGADGLYRWEHVPIDQEFSVIANAEGYQFFNMPKQGFDAGQVEKEINVTLVPTDSETGGPLLGKVTDIDGNPLAGVKLSFSADWGRSKIETNTAADGSYRFEEIPIMRMEVPLVAEAEGYGTKSHKIRTLKSEQVVDFVLEKGQYLGGFVYSESGEPLSGVIVSQVIGNFYPNQDVETTDDDGFFHLENLSSPAKLSFHLTGYERVTEDVKELNREDFEVTLKGNGILLGRVVDENGTPVTRFTLKTITRGVFISPGLYQGVDYDSPQGHFRVENLPLNKELGIAIHTEKYDTVTFNEVKGVIEKEAVREDFVLNRDGFLVEGVITYPDGLPIPNTTVKYASMTGSGYTSQFSWMSYEYMSTSLPETQTDELGRFRFENLSESDAGYVIVNQEGLARFVSDDVMKLDEEARTKLKLVVAPEGKIDCFINREAYPFASRLMVQRQGSQADYFLHSIDAEKEHHTLDRLAAGNYTISLKKDMMSMNTVEEQKVKLEIGARGEAHFGYDEVFTVSGLVTLNGAAPGVTPVFLYKDRNTLYEARCDANGIFSIEEVKPGKYKLILAKGDIPSGYRLANYLGGHPNHADLEVVDKDVQGSWDFKSYIRVTGRILSKQKVHDLILSEAKGFNLETKSDVNGDFIFEGVPPGTFKLSVGNFGNYSVLLRDVMVENESEDLDLGEIPFDDLGQLKLEFNELPEANYLQVTFFSADIPDNQLNDNNLLTSRSASIRSKTSAEFTELPEGQIKIKVRAFPRAIRVDPAVSILNLAPESQSLKLTLSATTSFSFYVSNDQKMAEVKIHHEETGVTTQLQEVTFQQWNDATEPYGLFFKNRGRVVGFPEGTYNITATTEKGTHKGRVTIKLGKEESVNLE